MKDMTDELGITICATHISFDRIKEDTQDVISTAQALELQVCWCWCHAEPVFNQQGGLCILRQGSIRIRQNPA